MDCEHAIRLQLNTEYQRGIEQKNMETGVEELFLPPSPSADIIETNIENQDPEDVRIVHMFEKENSDALKLRFGITITRNAKMCLKEEYVTSLRFYKNLGMFINDSHVMFPKLTEVISCLRCDQKYLYVLALDRHIRNHLFEEEKIRRKLLMKVKTEPVSPKKRGLQQQQFGFLKLPIDIKKIKVEDVSTTTAPLQKILGKRAFQCPICKKRMNTEEVLQTHLSKYHPVKIEPEYHPVKIEPEYHPVKIEPEYHAVKIKPEYHAVKIEPEYHPVKIEPEYHAVKIEPEYHPVKIEPEYHPVKIEPEYHHVKIEPEYHHVKIEPEYQQLNQCDVCGKMVTSKDLKRHKMSHDETERVCCEYCERDYKRKQTLRAHIKKAHPEFYFPERRGGGRKK